MTKKDSSLLAFIVMILVVMLVILLTSCSDKATRQLHRSEKLLNKAIANGAKVSADTIFIDKQVFIPEIKTDTVFESKQGDTVLIEKERLKIKYVNLPGDSVYIYGESKKDTVIMRMPFAVTKKINSGHTNWDMIILAIFCIPVGWLLISFVVIPIARKKKASG